MHMWLDVRNIKQEPADTGAHEDLEMPPFGEVLGKFCGRVN